MKRKTVEWALAWLILTLCGVLAIVGIYFGIRTIVRADITAARHECGDWGQVTGFQTKYEHVYLGHHECLVLVAGKWIPRDLVRANQVEVGK